MRIRWRRLRLHLSIILTRREFFFLGAYVEELVTCPEERVVWCSSRIKEEISLQHCHVASHEGRYTWPSSRRRKSLWSYNSSQFTLVPSIARAIMNIASSENNENRHEEPLPKARTAARTTCAGLHQQTPPPPQRTANTPIQI